MQVASIPIGAAAVGAWNAYAASREPVGRAVRLRAIVVAGALAGIL